MIFATVNCTGNAIEGILGSPYQLITLFPHRPMSVERTSICFSKLESPCSTERTDQLDDRDSHSELMGNPQVRQARQSLHLLRVKRLKELSLKGFPKGKDMIHHQAEDWPHKLDLEKGQNPFPTLREGIQLLLYYFMTGPLISFKPNCPTVKMKEDEDSVYQSRRLDPSD